MQKCAKLLFVRMKLFRKSSFAQHAQEKRTVQKCVGLIILAV